jgi:hypothetical protein
MNKIVGFLITTKNLENFNPDVFNVGLKTINLKYNDYNIYLWGIGDIEKCKIRNKYTLSFPLHDNLLDRNILIYFEDNNIIVENDWLGSIPIFYNKKEKIVSTISNLCLMDKDIDNEGLMYFANYGYSAFETTIFKEVNFLRYFSKLIINKDGIRVIYKDDPVLDKYFFDETTTTDEVIHSIQNYITSVEEKTKGEIIIPTSGGYDSRLLNFLVGDKTRIYSFTYGISKEQYESYEVVYAKKLSQILGTNWKQVELDNFTSYIDDWFKIYGFSTHLHGMYHIEFYKKILGENNFSSPILLSGIVGDAWAGSIKHKPILTEDDLVNLAYTHGLSLDLRYLVFKKDKPVKRKEFFEFIKPYLNNNKIKTVMTIRTKIVLLSYLLQIPEYLGIPAWTPFLSFNIVKKMLNLPNDIWQNRIWQKNFFRERGLNLEEMKLKVDKRNSLDYSVAIKSSFDPIDVNLMSKYFYYERLIDINRILKERNFFETIVDNLLFIPKIRGILRIIGFDNTLLRALYDYYIIKAVEKGLKYER